MRKILLAIACILFSFNAMAEDELANDNIYFFTHRRDPPSEIAVQNTVSPFFTIIHQKNLYLIIK